jgi:hypothetical protein
VAKGSNPGGRREFSHPSRLALGLTQPPVVALTIHPHIAPRLKKEYIYTYNPSLDLRGQSWGDLYHFSNLSLRTSSARSPVFDSISGLSE